MKCRRGGKHRCLDVLYYLADFNASSMNLEPLHVQVAQLLFPNGLGREHNRSIPPARAIIFSNQQPAINVGLIFGDKMSYTDQHIPRILARGSGDRIAILEIINCRWWRIFVVVLRFGKFAHYPLTSSHLKHSR